MPRVFRAYKLGWGGDLWDHSSKSGSSILCIAFKVTGSFDFKVQRSYNRSLTFQKASFLNFQIFITKICINGTTLETSAAGGAKEEYQ
ncbi:hypothetical protein HPP92_005772 [Vanilla planifolia]|uniref:Uncharacterized protein n=1 Tax=Vanilla planifolia TaxID=51239 RepID=A0A835RNG4_VANPL|nr:hypothetical protein HPP92_005772 [Vanilla planifolia]